MIFFFLVLIKKHGRVSKTGTFTLPYTYLTDHIDDATKSNFILDFAIPEFFFNNNFYYILIYKLFVLAFLIH